MLQNILNFFQKNKTTDSFKTKNELLEKDRSIDENKLSTKKKVSIISIPNFNNNSNYTLSKWLINNQQTITKGTTIVVIENGKTMMEFDSFYSGKIEIVAKKGTILKPGAIIAKIHH